MVGLDWLYSFDELRAYSLNTKQGKERLNSVIKHLPEMLETAGAKLPKKPRVLCLMAGSCVEGIALAQTYGADVTCLDLRKQSLAQGVREAKRRKLNLKALVGDAKVLWKHVSGKFDLVTVLGSPLPHLGVTDFDDVIIAVEKVLSKTGSFLIEQSDLIFRVIPQYRDAFVSNLQPPVINIHSSFNARQGYFERLYYSRSRQGTFKVYLWSPWIIEYMLKKNGFSKVRVESYADPYNMAQTYLFTAQGVS